MAWVESVSPSFRARHDSAHADDAQRVLYSLEHTREGLGDLFPKTGPELTVVLHRSSVSLSLAKPLLPLAWFATAPAARRYLAGWVSTSELHVLVPAALEARGSGVPGSREMLLRTPNALFARRVVGENNRDLAARATPVRIARELRWAWLLEGAARWLGGQAEHSRPAIARRLHEGQRPSFPPGVRDAPLLGPTVIDLLAREEGEHAVARLACRLHPQGARAALSEAFRGRSFARTEDAWRSHLARLAAGRAPVRSPAS